MEFKQLEAFVQVVKLNSFSKAADKVFLSQPTISSHISSLEKELGVQLLIRSTKAVQPTKMGMEFYRYAEDILALRDQSIRGISVLNVEMKGEVDILASTVPAQYLLPEIVADFQKKYPEIVIRVHQATSQEVLEHLDNRDYDFGIIGAKVGGRKYEKIPFCEDQSVLILPKEMKLSEKDVNDNLREFFQSTPFVMREAGSGTRKELEHLLETLELTIEDIPSVAYFSDTQSIIHAVSKGMGISFVSQKAAQLYEEMNLIQTIPLSETISHRTFYIVYQKEKILSPVLTLFTDFMKDYYQR